MYSTKHRAKRIGAWGDSDEEIPGQAECGGAAGTEDIGVPWPVGGLPADPRRILLLSDEAHAEGAMKDEEIARVLQIGRATVERVRRRCVEEGIEAALERKRQLNRRPKRLDGQGEAHLIAPRSWPGQALACGDPPEGRAGWTLKLLADRLVECEIVESISPETVRQTLKKTNSSLG